MGAKLTKLRETIGHKLCSPDGGDSEAARRSDRCHDTTHRLDTLETGHDPAVHGAKLDDRNYNNDGFKKKTSTVTEQQQNNAAVAIQTQYRQHEAKAEVEELRREQAAIKIQSGFRGHVDREQVRKMREKHSTKKGEEIDIDLSDPEVQKAAAFIQSGFKGFKVRKQVIDEEKPSSIKESNIHHHHAATKIQAQFRGHLIRKQMRQAPKEQSRDTSDLYHARRHGAAVKIQSHYRGHLVRRTSKQKTPTRVESATLSSASVDSGADGKINEAATRIQAGVRGHLTRRQLHTTQISADVSRSQDKNTSRSEPGYEGNRQHQQGKDSPNAEKDLSNNRVSVDQADEAAEDVAVDQMLFEDDTSQAAVKIQAGFRGYKARKQLKGSRLEETENLEEDEEEGIQNSKGIADDNGDDFDLSNPEAEQAAIKIQAGFKGFKVRKELYEKHARESLEEATPRDNEDDVEVGGVDPLVDLDDPDMETAAVKIQAGFKGMKARREVKAMLSERRLGETRDLEEVSEFEIQEEDEQEEARTQEVDGADAGETDDVIADEPLGEDEVTDEPAGDDLVTDEATGYDLVTDEPTGDGQVGEDQVTDEPAGDVQDEPSGNDQVTDEQTGNEQVTDEPTGYDQVTDDPTGDEQVTDQPTGDDQVTDEPTGDDQGTDDPTGDDQVTDVQTAEELTTEDQVTEDLESQDLFS